MYIYMHICLDLLLKSFFHFLSNAGCVSLSVARKWRPGGSLRLWPHQLLGRAAVVCGGGPYSLHGMSHRRPLGVK